MKRHEIEEWKEKNGKELNLGTMVKISPSCTHYESEYDQNTTYMVVYLYVDSDGLNVGVNEGGNDSWICGTDSYRACDLLPADCDS